MVRVMLEVGSVRARLLGIILQSVAMIDLRS